MTVPADIMMCVWARTRGRDHSFVRFYCQTIRSFISSLFRSIETLAKRYWILKMWKIAPALNRFGMMMTWTWSMNAERIHTLRTNDVYVRSFVANMSLRCFDIDDDAPRRMPHMVRSGSGYILFYYLMWIPKKVFSVSWRESRKAFRDAFTWSDT